jgi:hypothetical protein
MIGVMPRKTEPPIWPYDDSAIEFLNVDLDVWSRKPLRKLADAFGDEGLHYEGWEGTRFGVHYSGSTLTSKEGADSIVRGLVAKVESLPAAARVVWNAAERREFNIGIRSGFSPRSVEYRLSSETIRRVGRVKGGVVVTVYATGKHFSGRKGEPPTEIVEPGTFVGPSSQEAMKIIRKLESGASTRKPRRPN